MSDNHAKATQKYNKKNITGVYMGLNKTTDADILKKLSSVLNKQGYIKNLIRDDLKDNRVNISLSNKEADMLSAYLNMTIRDRIQSKEYYKDHIKGDKGKDNALWYSQLEEVINDIQKQIKE